MTSRSGSTNSNTYSSSSHNTYSSYSRSRSEEDEMQGGGRVRDIRDDRSMETPYMQKKKKKGCERLAAFSFMHTAVTLLYLVLFALSVTALAVRHYASPLISINNVYQEHFTGAQLTMGALELQVPLDEYTAGGNVTLTFVIDVWSISMDLNISVPYLPARNEVIHQRYTVEDLPCKELRSVMRSEQLCLLLATFLFFLMLLLSLSNFFSRVLLPVMWVLGWVCVAMCSAACCLSIRLLTRASCKETPLAFPAFKDLAVPQVGFAFLLVCMAANLITVVLTVFL